VSHTLPAYRVRREQRRFVFDKDSEPALRVPSGATVTFETVDCFSNKVTSADQRYPAEEGLLAILGAYNPVSGPVYVTGAAPGDVLAVAVEHIRLGTAAPFAVTLAFGHGSAYVSAEVPGMPTAGATRICPIEDEPGGGQAIVFPAGHGPLRLPARPMIGTIGTAPAGPPAPSLGYAAGHGGNFDCPLVTAGSVLYLPVNVPGALLSLGDVHALMGDAEITGTALETSGDVTVTITNLPAGTRHLNLPHLDTAEMIGVVGCVAGASLQANLEAAMVEMHRRLTGEGGLATADAYHLTGATARVVVNQCVSPPDWSAVYVGVPRSICRGAADAGSGQQER
jgi:amidase